MSIVTVAQNIANAAKNSFVYKLALLVNQVSDRVNQMNAVRGQNCVMPEPVSPFGRAGVSVDANAEDIETDNPIVIRHNSLFYNVAAISAIDISAKAAGGATIATSKWGIGWVFASIAGVGNVEVDKDAQDYATQIEAWTAWATAANTLPPGATDVAIGAVMVNEGGSGPFTWGTDSITNESETYFDFFGIPGIISAMATFALEAAAATFSYGAATLRLGSGTIVTATGKTGVTLGGSNVAAGAVGAWLFYVLADDVERAHQLSAAYASLDAAKMGVQGHNPNPFLPLLGVLYIENKSGGAFVPGTTALDAGGITATFVKVGPLGDQLAYGVGLSGAAFSAVDKIKFRETGYPS